MVLRIELTRPTRSAHQASGATYPCPPRQQHFNSCDNVGAERDDAVCPEEPRASSTQYKKTVAAICADVFIVVGAGHSAEPLMSEYVKFDAWKI